MWCDISGEAAGENWHWSLLGVKGLKTVDNRILTSPSSTHDTTSGISKFVRIEFVAWTEATFTLPNRQGECELPPYLSVHKQSTLTLLSDAFCYTSGQLSTEPDHCFVFDLQLNRTPWTWNRHSYRRSCFRASYEIIVLLKKLRQRSGRFANRGTEKRLRRAAFLAILTLEGSFIKGMRCPFYCFQVLSSRDHKLPPGMWDQISAAFAPWINVSQFLRQIKIAITSQHPTFSVKNSAVNDEHFGCDSSDVYTWRKRSSVRELRVPQRERDSVWQNPSESLLHSQPFLCRGKRPCPLRLQEMKFLRAVRRFRSRSTEKLRTPVVLIVQPRISEAS